jgi:hypothetical protein
MRPWRGDADTTRPGRIASRRLDATTRVRVGSGAAHQTTFAVGWYSPRSFLSSSSSGRSSGGDPARSPSAATINAAQATSAAVSAFWGTLRTPGL